MSECPNIIGNTMSFPYLHNFLIIISTRDIYQSELLVICKTYFYRMRLKMVQDVNINELLLRNKEVIVRLCTVSSRYLKL